MFRVLSFALRVLRYAFPLWSYLFCVKLSGRKKVKTIKGNVKKRGERNGRKVGIVEKGEIKENRWKKRKRENWKREKSGKIGKQWMFK